LGGNVTRNVTTGWEYKVEVKVNRTEREIWGSLGPTCLIFCLLI
jgi:hypothetical protein